MSDFVEKITLDLTGTAVDGSAARGLGETGEGIKGLTGDLEKLSKDTGAEATLGKISAAVDGIGASVLKMAGAFVGFEAIKALVGDVFDAVKEHENLTLTIAATMAQTNGWSNSMAIARGQLEKLKETAALVNGTEIQMVDTFNLLKRTFGGTSDEAVDLTGKLALLARQYNTTVDTLATRLAMAGNTGNLMPRGVAGIALTSTGIDATELQLMKDAGQAMAYLNAKISDNPELVDQLKNTWSYLTAELGKAKHEAMETIGMGFEPLKVVLQELIGNINSPATQSSFQNLSGQIRGLNKDLVDLAFAGKTSGFQIPSFTDTIITPIIKGARGALAELTLLAVEVNTVVQYVWDVVTNPIKYALDGPGSLARLKQMLADAVKAYKENAAQIAAIQSPFVMVSSHDTPEKPTPPSPPGRDVQAVKDDSEEIAAIVQDNWNKVNAYNQTGLAKEIALEEAATAKEIASLESKFLTDKEFIDARLSYVALGAAKEQALNLKSQAANEAEIERQRKQLVDNADWLEGEETKLYDDLAGVTDSYYTKQQASIDKMIDREAALLDKRLDDDKLTQAGYDALMGTLQKLYDAQTGQLAREQDSIIGFRKTMEEEAALLVKTTDSVAGGIAAGVKTIAASVKSTTEIVRDYVVGAFGGITTGLDTALQHLESGAGSIKDVWKSMSQSMLKSFNTAIEEMVKNWLVGLKGMKDGASGSGGLGGLFAGAGAASSIDKEGNVVYHGGTIDTTTKGQGTQGAKVQQQPGMSTGEVIGVAGLTALAGISAMSATDTVLGSGVSQAGIQIGMMVATYVNVLVGVVIAAIGVIVSALLPRQEEFTARYRGAWMTQALTTGKATGAAGSDLEKASTAALTISNSMEGFFADMFKNVDPSVAAGIREDLNKKIKAYFDSLGDFGVHAGGGADFAKDIAQIFEEILPKGIMHAMFGQTQAAGQQNVNTMWGGQGTLPFGNVDEKSPLVSFLTGIGFSIAKVNEIAGQIETQSTADFQKYFSGLVAVVLSAGTLGKTLAKTYGETVSDAAAAAAKSPAGKLADQAAAVTDLLKAVSFYTGTEQITKGQEAIAAAQTFYDNAKTAMLQLSAMALQTTQDVADETKKVLDLLKTPAELASQSVQDLQHDYERMKFAANPEDLAKAWAQAKSDFEAVAGELVNRIKQIKTLLDDIHTLQAAIVTGPAPDQQSDPRAWLSQNMVAIGKYETAMKAANPGSPEQISAATTMAGLIRDRYQMELQFLDRIKSAIASVNQTIDDALYNINLGEAKTPDDKSKLIYGKIDDLYRQLQQAKTPEEISGLVSQITGLTNQLLQLAPAGEQGHDAMVAYVRGILEEVRKTSTGILGTEATSTQTDISKLGTKLAEAETIMAAALTKDQADLDALVFHFNSAGAYMTDKLNAWGVEIQGQLNALGPVLADMVTNFTDVNAAISGDSGTGGGGTGGGKNHVPLGDNLTGLGSGVDDANSAIVDFTAAVRASTAALSGKAT